MKKYLTIFFAVSVIGLMGISSCSLDAPISSTDAALENTVSSRAVDSNTYDEVLALEYYPSQGFHVLSVRNSVSGEVDTYYGDNKSWTKLNDNRDAGVAWGQFLGMSVGDNGDFLYAFLYNGKVAVQSGREFYNKPYFDVGKYIISK